MTRRRRRPPEDVLTFRGVPTGVTGIPRLREWDAVVLVEVPELEATALQELELEAPPAGDVRASAAEPVPAEAVARLAAELDTQLDRPYEAVAVRRDAGRWAAGARALRGLDEIELAPELAASVLEVVRPPGGGLEVRVDGEDVDPGADRLVAEAAEELDRLAGERFESFAARAERAAGGRWTLTVDPL